MVVAAAVVAVRLSQRKPKGEGAMVASATPFPTAAVTPEPTATETPPEPSATVAEPSPTDTPSPTPTATAIATPVRLKPGERYRSSAPSPSAAAPITEPAASPIASPQNAAPAAVAPKGPIVREIAASSQLNNEFRPNYAFDGNPATGWTPKGRGGEQTLFVHFKAPAEVRSVSILNGDGRSEEQYKTGNRVKTLRVVLSDGTNQLLTFKDVMKMQRFALAKPVTASWAKFEIVSVYSGKSKQTTISEIGFNEDEQ